MSASKYPGTRAFSRLLFDAQSADGMSFLRGHLLLEQALATLIGLSNSRASVLVDGSSFSAKLRVCDGMGLIEAELAAAINQVNRQRNKLAHDLEATFTVASGWGLTHRFPPRIRKAVIDVLVVTASERGFSLDGAAASQRTLESKVDAGDTIKAIFLVLGIGLGRAIQECRFKNDFGQLMLTYEFALAIAEEEGSAKTAQEIREHLGLPDGPDPRHALAELFPGDAGGGVASAPGR